MELRDYLNVISARRHIVLGATLVVVLVAVAVSLLQPPVFEAQSKVLISEQDTGAALLGQVIPELSSQPERGLQTQVQLVLVQPVLETTIRKLGLKQTPGKLLKRVSVTSVGQTNIIAITAKAPTRDEAADIANTMAEVYVASSRERKRAALKEAADEVEQRLEDARRQILELGRQVEATGKSNELAAELQILTETYATLAEKLETLRVNERLESGAGAVVQPAVAETKPVEPKPVRNALMGLLVGAVFGLTMAFLYEYLDNSIKSSEEAERVYGATVLGIVPMETLEKGVKRHLAIIRTPGSAAAESYRVVRNSLDFINFEHNLKSLLITSAAPAEGKSTVAANLAVALAQAGKKVVLMSTDFRRPTTHQFLQVDNTIGLSEVLLGSQTLESALQRPTGDQLLVLAAGKMPPNPSELLASTKMKEVLESLEEWADWVLIDSPPVLAVADPVSVARWVDGVLMVSKAGESTKEAAAKAVELLGKVGAKPIGVVVWGLDESKNRPGYGYGYGYYAGGYYYYRSYYGYGTSKSKKKSNSSQEEFPSAESWVPEKTTGRKIAAVVGRILSGILMFLVVLAIAAVVAYFLDQYYGWGVWSQVSRFWGL